MKKDAEMKQENVKTVGTGVGFERIRRITGYLVGTVDRFNNGKRAEEHDRVELLYGHKVVFIIVMVVIILLLIQKMVVFLLIQR